MVMICRKLLAEAIANYMVVNGCASTSSGNKIFYFEDIIEHFGIARETLDNLREDIESCLADCPQIQDQDGIWVDDNSFSLMFYGNYCNVEIA